MRRSLSGLRRLSFEIDDHEIFTGVEHLAEMIVAVTAHALRGDFVRAQALEALHDIRFRVGNNAFGFGARSGGNRGRGCFNMLQRFSPARATSAETASGW